MIKPILTERVLLVDKPVSLTPLEVINYVKKKYNITHLKIGYAGRLDPMAQGLLILLIDPETKNRSFYQNLNKTYIFEVLFGVSTDTYDSLGILTKSAETPIYKDINTILTEKIQKYIGKMSQIYPPYSSKRVDGKALFQWAKEDRLLEIVIPRREIEIYSINIMKIYMMNREIMYNYIIQNISNVNGDFRQNEISKSWNNYFKSKKDQTFTIAKIKVKCSSGTYVRSLANDIGNSIGCGAIALKIKRTEVGNYKLKNAIKIKDLLK